MLPSGTVEIREYLDSAGRNPFREWFVALNSEAARKITVALYRIALGNFSNVKGVGAGVLECKVHFGQGYRVYFGKDGERTMIVLGGGTKKAQQRDIALAIRRWDDYKRRKKQGKE